MSKFSEFTRRTQEEVPPEYVETYGAFGCQRCMEQVNEAKYFPVEKMLIWECSAGHRSFIEEFQL